MEKQNFISKLADKIKVNKKLEIGIYAGLIGAALLIYFASFLGADNKSGTEKTGSDNANINVSADISSSVEERLKTVLSCIKGAGRVEVMITYETGKEIVPAMSVNTETDTSQTSSNGTDSLTSHRIESSEPTTINQSGSNEIIVLTEKNPTIKGVIVIAEGAEDISVKNNLQFAVETVLGIASDKVEVFSMNININKAG